MAPRTFEEKIVDWINSGKSLEEVEAYVDSLEDQGVLHMYEIDRIMTHVDKLRKKSK